MLRQFVYVIKLLHKRQNMSKLYTHIQICDITDVSITIVTNEKYLKVVQYFCDCHTDGITLHSSSHINAEESTTEEEHNWQMRSSRGTKRYLPTSISSGRIPCRNCANIDR